jgi:hypothetical protein
MQHLPKSPWPLPDWAVRSHPVYLAPTYTDIAGIRLRLRHIRVTRERAQDCQI